MEPEQQRQEFLKEVKAIVGEYRKECASLYQDYKRDNDGRLKIAAYAIKAFVNLGQRQNIPKQEDKDAFLIVVAANTINHESISPELDNVMSETAKNISAGYISSSSFADYLRVPEFAELADRLFNQSDLMKDNVENNPLVLLVSEEVERHNPTITVDSSGMWTTEDRRINAVQKMINVIRDHPLGAKMAASPSNHLSA